MTAIGSVDSRRLSYAMLRSATNGAENYLPIPSSAAVEAPLGKILKDLHDKHPGELDALGHPQTASHVDYCRAHARIMDEILQLPEDQQAPVARYLMALDSNSHATATGSNGGSGGSSSPTMSPLPLHLRSDK